MWQVGIMKVNLDGVVTEPVTRPSQAMLVMCQALGRVDIEIEPEEAEMGLWLVEMTEAEVDSLMVGKFPGRHNPAFQISIEKP